MTAPRPYNLVAELTYRCPLHCPYCSNPTNHASVRDGLDAAAWAVAFRQAAALGCVHVGLTGGEPSARRDLPEIVASAADAGLYTHIVTAGTPLDPAGLETLQGAGLRSVQLSLQDAEAEAADHIAGTRSFEAKRRIAEATRALGLPLVINVVLHRSNIEHVPQLIALAKQFGAHRLELANAQYHGWGLRNRAALLPTRDAIERAAAHARRGQEQHRELEIQFVLPDYFSRRPKPCMGGWGAKTMIVAPDGKVLPCHGAAALPGLEFWTTPARSIEECWVDSPGMNAYRGTAWMQPPCRTCADRDRDFGGCRCQAFALTGDAAATDPACELAPQRDAINIARAEAASRWAYRRS